MVTQLVKVHLGILASSFYHFLHLLGIDLRIWLLNSQQKIESHALCHANETHAAMY